MPGGVASYQYISDAGQLYQVIMPSDFADALGATPAIGTEPYLPVSISPRYGTYLTLIPLQWRQAIISTPGGFSNLPPVLAVAGSLFTSRSAIGESIQANPFGATPVAAGPQGPPGVAGAPGAALPLEYWFNQNTVGGAIPVAAATLAATITPGVIGTFLVWGSIGVTVALPLDIIACALGTNSGAVTLAGGEQDAVSPAVGELCLSCFALMQTTAPTDDITLFAASNKGAAFLLQGNNSQYLTAIAALQVA